MPKQMEEIEKLEELLKTHHFVWIWCQQDQYPRPSGGRAYTVNRRTVAIRPNAGGRHKHQRVDHVEHWRIKINKVRMTQEPPPKK